MARAEWLARRQAELLPIPYFHLVFTLPAEMAALALQNKRLMYGLLFEAASQTIAQVAANPRHLGAHEVGVLAVLHTWGQNLLHHPHSLYSPSFFFLFFLVSFFFFPPLPLCFSVFSDRPKTFRTVPSLFFFLFLFAGLPRPLALLLLPPPPPLNQPLYLFFFFPTKPFSAAERLSISGSALARSCPAIS